MVTNCICEKKEIKLKKWIVETKLNPFNVPG